MGENDKEDRSNHGRLGEPLVGEFNPNKAGDLAGNIGKLAERTALALVEAVSEARKILIPEQ